MRTVGIVATAASGVLAVLVVALGVTAVPDIRRYLSIRRM